MRNIRLALTAMVVLNVLLILVYPANAQCPAFGADTTCGIVITITNTGATATPTGQGPFDGIEDTLVGVVNNSNIPIKSLILHSSLNIFAFDGDGIDSFGAPGNAIDTTGYGGPNSFFTNMSADGTFGTVNFIVPLAPNGGTTYFSLEEAIDSATACSTIINNSIKKQASSKNICATFTPNQLSGQPPTSGMPGLTLAQAAQLCGFKDFDWIQKKNVQFDPSPFFARNLGGAFDSKITGFVRLTSKRAPYDDPPNGGGYAPGFGGGITPDNSFPFYYDQSLELPGHEDGTVPVACTLTASAGNTLTFHDAPSNSCLPGGTGAGTPPCTDAILAPGAKTEPKGSFGGFVTHLAGVSFDGTATDLGIGFTWTSNNNGTTGGVSINKTELPADGNGTGGITITSVSEITTFGGITVTGVNGGQPGTPATLASGATCDGTFSGTFNGSVNVSAGQNCMFINGYITGDVQVNGGNLVLSGALIGGNVLATSGAFSIGPSTTINGNLEAANTPTGTQSQICGSTVSGNLQFHNNGSSVQIGSASETFCVGNTIVGNLEVHNNTGSTAIFNNIIEGNLDNHNNSGSTQVFNNTVTQNLQCVNNALITGGENTAGQKQGQCTGF